MTLRPADQRSPEWFKQRIGKITGSRVAKVTGSSPFGNRETLKRELVREFFGAESEFKGSAATRWGVKHEEIAAMKFEETTRKKVVEAYFVQHPSIDYLGASPDGYIDDHALIEIKCPCKYFEQELHLLENPQVAYDPANWSEIELFAADLPHYVDQMQLQMLCTKRTLTYFVQWTPRQIIIEEVHFDFDWLPRNLPLIDHFISEYRAIVTDKKLSKEYLEPKFVERIDTDWLYLSEAIREVDTQIKHLQTTRKELAEQLIHLAAEQPSKGNGVTVFSSRRSTFDRKAAEQKLEAHGEDPKAFINEGEPSWSVRVN